MSTRKVFNTSRVPRASTAFPQAVIAGNLIFISGTTGVDPITGQISESFEEQALQAFRNVITILEEIGSSADAIVKTTVFMVSGNEFSMLNKVYAAVFGKNAPARSTPQVNPFPGGVLLSVECIAVKE